MSDEELFAAHYLPVMRVCLRTLRDVDDAEDAVQETFRRAVQQGGELHADPLPWLITVAKRVCLDELRRRRSGREALERSALLSPADTAPTDAEPERVVVGHLFVRELLGRLTPAERRVVASRVYADRTSSDTAATLGVTSTTTRVLLARARAKLRTYLENTQAAFVALPVLATRSLHNLRRRLLGPQWGAEGASGLVMPAVLAITAALTPGLSGAGAVAGTPHAPAISMSPLALRPVGDALAVDPSHPGGVSLPNAGPTGHARGGRDVQEQRVPDAFLAQPPADVHRVYPLDVQPSPDYQDDHTVVMLGQYQTCNVSCFRVFMTTDDGATWVQRQSINLQAGGTLVLPADTFDQKHFYVTGTTGLQMTLDGGDNFVNITPTVGYVTAAPPWSGLDVVLSNAALWRLAAGLTPVPIASFDNPDQSAVGHPAFLRTATGYEMLQPLSVDSVGTDAPDEVVRCTPVCGPAVALPFGSGPVHMVLSPDESTDHTIFAAATPYALAVSHDDGHSFSAVGAPPLQALLAVHGPDGRRLVAIVGRLSPLDLEVSDDDGTTWRTAAIPASLHAGEALALTSVHDGKLMAVVRVAGTADHYFYICSRDGGAWASCPADDTT